MSAVGGRYALNDNCEVPDTLEVTYEYQKGDHKFLMVWSQTDANSHGLENKGLGIMFQGTWRQPWWPTTPLVPDHRREESRKIDELTQKPTAIGWPSSRVG